MKANEVRPEPLRLWTAADRRRQMADEIRAGLTAVSRSIPSKYFYDARGSRLFEAITHQPEYYPPDAEVEILERVAGEIVEAVRPEELVEIGSGFSRKTRLLLEAMERVGGRRYVPFDVSEEALESAAAQLGRLYPWLTVRGVVGDFERHVGRIPRAGRGVVAFLGSTIGNFPPGRRRGFFRDVAGLTGRGDAFLLGVDLVKEPSVLEAAYNDAAGVTASFNRNVLRVLDRELGADFDPEAFDHVAFYDPESAWIEMRLRATRAMVVQIAALGLTVELREGEEIRTEISCKFTREGVGRELGEAGLVLDRWETDEAGRFALALARVSGADR